MPIRKKGAIVGYGTTKMGRIPDKDFYQLNAELIIKAIEDANIEKDEVDGLLVTSDLSSQRKPRCAAEIAENLGIHPRFSSEIALGGAACCSMVQIACCAIESGLAETIVCSSADNSLSRGLRSTITAMAASAHQEFEFPFGAFIPTQAAMLARRYMHEYGATSEQLARISVIERQNASMHPDAAFRDPITIDDVLNSRIISEPLHLLDCAAVHDGGAAFIVTSAKRAKKLTEIPVYVLGFGTYVTHASLMYCPNWTTSAARTAGEIAFKMAGVKPQELDVHEIYDPFTCHVLIFLEDLGFCKKGEGGKFVEDNDFSFKGNFPLNTHGGLLSYGHPGVPGGVSHIIEATCQLMGRADERQVKNANLAIAHGQGGVLSEQTVLILGN